MPFLEDYRRFSAEHAIFRICDVHLWRHTVISNISVEDSPLLAMSIV